MFKKHTAYILDHGDNSHSLVSISRRTGEPHIVIANFISPASSDTEYAPVACLVHRHMHVEMVLDYDIIHLSACFYIELDIATKLRQVRLLFFS